ncbi:hypothetical protein ACJRO7_003405 [Eucalyptus globulus]|uniref:Uncharacterized protein n=1 Tax=Eucalyptus globulus TaxID=34317 RepID=A0ABD3IUJ9_EUCGL
MSLPDSETQNEKRSHETSEVYDSVFGFLMNFANEAETIVPHPKSGAVVDDDTMNQVQVDGEEKPLENVGNGNAGEMFDKLPLIAKDELLKYVFGEILGNMLDKLPEDGKEAFLVRCFDGLFPKLPCESQRAIEIKANDLLSPSQEAFATLSTPESPSAFGNQFPDDALQPDGIKIRYPNTIIKPKGGKGGAGGGGVRGGRRW